MSFQDVGPQAPFRMRRNHPQRLPRVTAIPSPTGSPSNSRKQTTRLNAAPPRGRQSVAELGRQLRDDLLNSSPLRQCSDSSDDDSRAESRDEQEAFGDERHTASKPRDKLRSQSNFAVLTRETHQYQKLVADLETILKDAGETPEAAWRARILVKSAQDADVDLWGKLQAHEKSLLYCGTSHQTDSHRAQPAQMACAKLLRDFTRSHTSMVASLALYEMRQKAEVSQLGSARWGGGGTAGAKGEDFFDRAMRQRELERMNESMRQVNDIYHELAGLVERQQENLDRIDREVDHAAANVEAGADEIHCFGQRGAAYSCGGGLDSCTDEDIAITLSEDNPTRGLRVSENFHWYMPFETLNEDIASVKNDIVLVGKGIVSSAKRLDCGALQSTNE